MPGLPPIRLSVGGVDFTTDAQNITWANADPGGCQTASFDVNIAAADRIIPGDKVVIYDGLSIIWIGRVAEPAKAIQRGWGGRRKLGSGTTSVSCEGAGAVANDNKMSMVYVDREFNRWTGPNVNRQLFLAQNSYQTAGFSIGADPSGKSPALVAQIRDSWVSPYRPDCEIYYDAGPDNVIAAIYYDFTALAQPSGISMLASVYGTPDGNTNFEGTANLYAVYPSVNAGYYFLPIQYRYGVVQLLAQATPGGAQGGVYDGFWTNLVVYGNHGLAGRGPDPVGYYPSDIARHAAQQCLTDNPGTFTLGQVDTLSNYTVFDYKQYNAVQHERIISDMAKLAVAHYGWWPPKNCFSDLAEFTFRAYPTQPTAYCSLSDCNEADLSERLSNMYSSVRVTYNDAAGLQSEVVVTQPNAVLDRVGIQREQQYDLGLSSAAAAQAFASFALQALYAQARTAGTIELPRQVRNSMGALIRSYRLRAGIDRLKISDLPIRDRLLGDYNDGFRVTRVESHCDTSSGEVMTRVELDSGANLVETLQARFDAAIRLGQGG